MRGFNLKKIYNIYVKIAQAHFVYQPSKPKSITAMPFDWIEVQNLLEKYLEDQGADFDALCKEYVSENVKDDHLPSAQPRMKGKWVGYDGDWLKTMCKCSECGAMIDINEKYRNFFCYHCGADMRGE